MLLKLNTTGTTAMLSNHIVRGLREKRSATPPLGQNGTFSGLALKLMLFRGSTKSQTIFEPRSRERDAANDVAKRQAVIAVIERARNDLENEMAGLLRRHETQRPELVRSSQPLMANNDDNRLRLPLDEMERAMIYCEERLREIEAAKVRYDSLLKAARDAFCR